MRDDYLWDPMKAGGSPDEEIARLEKLLGRFRSPDASALPLPEGAAVQVFPRRASHGGWRKPVSIAAAAVLIIAAGWITLSWQGSPTDAWRVARLEGSPRVGLHVIGETLSLRPGQTLETDSSSRARIDVGEIGEVEVGPDSRVQLLEARQKNGSLSLEQGTIQAVIWAPPRCFLVRTPSAVAVDLGCRYTLHVNPDGDGWMRVTTGWVAFQKGGRESFVPVGAMCLIHHDSGPETPFYEDSPKEFQKALASFDASIPNPAKQPAPNQSGFLQLVLHFARPRDAFTLWHLLSRSDGDDRGRVFDRLAQFIPPPAGVTREGILAGDSHMEDLWWDALGLRDTEWWREWKRDFPSK